MLKTTEIEMRNGEEKVWAEVEPGEGRGRVFP